MSHDRITQVRIRGLRAIDELVLDVSGLVTLIGDNGSGKSCVVEALSMLRLASKPLSHVPDISKRHGDFLSLWRRGSGELGLGVTVEGAGPKIVYDFTIGLVGASARVVQESVDVYVDALASEPLHVLIRTDNETRVFEPSQNRLVGVHEQSASGGQVQVGAEALALPWLGVAAQPAIRRLVAALGSIDVHVPFETRGLWLLSELGLTVGPRLPCLLETATKLNRFGINLPNAFQTLRNRGGAAWTRLLERAQIGLGEDLRDFSLTPLGRGHIGLEALFGAFPEAPLPADSLSDGQLAYLCFLVLFEFHESNSLLVFDEPEVHLHPQLLGRVAWLFEEAATKAPVIVATHSDRFLDSLSAPAESVVLCQLDNRRAMSLRRVDSGRLNEWLEEYRGLGAIRAEGYEEHVFAQSQTNPKTANTP